MGERNVIQQLNLNKNFHLKLSNFFFQNCTCEQAVDKTIHFSILREKKFDLWLEKNWEVYCMKISKFNTNNIILVRNSNPVKQCLYLWQCLSVLQTNHSKYRKMDNIFLSFILLYSLSVIIYLEKKNIYFFIYFFKQVWFCCCLFL